MTVRTHDDNAVCDDEKANKQNIFHDGNNDPTCW